MPKEFWPKKNHNLRFHWGNPRMPIYTREIGDIPGCTMAPREGIYRPLSQERAQMENDARFARWAASMQEKETRIAHFSGDRYNEPIFGAFGEKL